MRLTRLKPGTILIRSFLFIMLEKLWIKSKYNKRHTLYLLDGSTYHFAQLLSLNMQLCNNTLLVIKSPDILWSRAVFIWCPHAVDLCPIHRHSVLFAFRITATGWHCHFVSGHLFDPRGDMPLFLSRPPSSNVLLNVCVTYLSSTFPLSPGGVPRFFVF